MVHRLALGILLMLVLLCPARSQHRDIELMRNARKVEVPFEYVNNFIVVQVVLNGIFPLRFLFDTGAENTILTRREITDLMRVNYRRRFTILGSDLSTTLYAYLAQGLQLQIGDNLLLSNRSLLVLEEDYFRFEEYAGIEVQGILGADILRRFVVQINYQRRVITFYEPGVFTQTDSRMLEIPVEFHRHKPFLTTPTGLPGGQSRPLKYLLDTGASLSTLVHTNTDTMLQLPPQVVSANIGMGLGGFLEGYAGRLPWLEMGGRRMEQLVTYYQDLGPDVDTSLINHRNGIIGNQVLERFVVLLDYPRERMYLRPTKLINRQFTFDRSGLSLAATGEGLRTLTVVNVTPNSPAAEAGILPGDEIRAINHQGPAFLSLQSALRKLRDKVGKRIRVKVWRNGQSLRFTFYLRELI